jgi:hypothetical protein
VLMGIGKYQQLTAMPLEPHGKPVRIVSPRLADPAQAADFELEMVEEDLPYA